MKVNIKSLLWKFLKSLAGFFNPNSKTDSAVRKSKQIRGILKHQEREIHSENMERDQKIVYGKKRVRFADRCNEHRRSWTIVNYRVSRDGRNQERFHINVYRRAQQGSYVNKDFPVIRP